MPAAQGSSQTSLGTNANRSCTLGGSRVFWFTSQGPKPLCTPPPSRTHTTHSNTHSDTHTHIHTHTDTLRCVHALTYTLRHILTHMQMHRHTETHTQMHAHTRTHTQMDAHTQKCTPRHMHRHTLRLVHVHTRMHTLLTEWADLVFGLWRPSSSLSQTEGTACEMFWKIEHTSSLVQTGAGPTLRGSSLPGILSSRLGVTFSRT